MAYRFWVRISVPAPTPSMLYKGKCKATSPSSISLTSNEVIIPFYYGQTAHKAEPSFQESVLELYIRKEGNVLFNDTLNTFYVWLFGIIHMIKGHSDRERENLLLPHVLLFPINSKGSFICIIPQTG